MPDEICFRENVSIDWLCCLEMLLYAVIHKVIQYKIPDFHEVMLLLIKQVRFPPHPRLAKVISLWLECCIGFRRVVGLPLMPFEVQQILNNIYSRSEDREVIFSDLSWLDEVDSFNFFGSEPGFNENVIVKTLLKLNPLTKLELSPTVMDDTLLVTVVTWTCLNWIHENMSVDRLSMTSIRNSILFASDFEELPIKISLMYLLRHKDEYPVLMFMVKSMLHIIKCLCPGFLLSQPLSWIRGSSFLRSLPKTQFKVLLETFSPNSSNNEAFLYSLRVCSIEQLDCFSDVIIAYFENLLKNPSSHENISHLWENWAVVHGNHPLPYKHLSKTLRRLQSMCESLFSVKFHTIHFLLDEPILVFRLPRALFANSFSLKVILLALKEGLLCCRVRCGEEMNRRSKIRSEALSRHGPDSAIENDSSMFLSLQDNIIARLLIELLIENSNDSDIEKLISDFFAWLLNYREAPSLAKLLLLQGNAAGYFNLICASYPSFLCLAQTMESILSTTGFDMNLNEFRSVILSAVTLFHHWKLHPLMLSIANLLPSFICKAYGGLSAYFDISGVDETVYRALDALKVYYPASLIKIMNGCAKLIDNDWIKRLTSRASELYEEQRSELYQIELGNRTQNSIVDTVPPPL